MTPFDDILDAPSGRNPDVVDTNGWVLVAVLQPGQTVNFLTAVDEAAIQDFYFKKSNSASGYAQPSAITTTLINPPSFVYAAPDVAEQIKTIVANLPEATFTEVGNRWGGKPSRLRTTAGTLVTAIIILLGMLYLFWGGEWVNLN